MPCGSKGPKGHGGMKRNKHGATENESDMDTGYLWGKGGQRADEKRTRPRGYLWSDKNRQRQSERDKSK